MSKKTVDIKFHVIKNGSITSDRDGMLRGLFFDIAGLRIHYDLKIAKSMAFNTEFKLIYFDVILDQAKKVMTLRCSNLLEN